MIKIIKSYNFDFLGMNWCLEQFNTRVVLPNSKYGFFNYNTDMTCIYIGKWLLTLTKQQKCSLRTTLKKQETGRNDEKNKY